MQAVIMAGGRGTRISSLNSEVPKPMIPIAGKPVLEHTVECLSAQGIRELIFVVGYKKESIISWFGTGEKWGVFIRYIEEEAPLGTAGALYFLKDTCKEDFFLINGDIIFDVDLHRFMQFHRERHAKASILVHPNNHPYDSSVITIGEGDKVICWHDREKLPEWYQNRVNAGIHILSPELLKGFTECRKRNLDREVLAPLITQGGLFAYCSPEYVKDMGTPERFALVEADIGHGRVKAGNLGNPQRAVFLDRDGTLNRYVGFLRRTSELTLLEGAAEAVRLLNENGYLVIVVTNQPVIARGEVSWEQLEEIHNKLETLLGRQGAYVNDIYVCPHHPDKGFAGERPEYKIKCKCRKPQPGMLLEAAGKYHIDLKKSWMIGDTRSDVEAGIAAGCKTAQIVPDGQTSEQGQPQAERYGGSLLELVKGILESEKEVEHADEKLG